MKTLISVRQPTGRQSGRPMGRPIGHPAAARQTRLAVLLAVLAISCGGPVWAVEPETLPSTFGRVAPGPVAVAQPAAAQLVTITDVVAMSRSGLDDQVIVNMIRQNGMATNLATAELISLRQHGISNTVISAMQAAAPPVLPASPPEVIRVYEAPRPPVVVHSYIAPRTYVVTRPYYYPSYHLQLGSGHHHGHNGHRGHHGSGGKTSFGFGITWR